MGFEPQHACTCTCTFTHDMYVYTQVFRSYVTKYWILNFIFLVESLLLAFSDPSTL